MMSRILKFLTLALLLALMTGCAAFRASYGDIVPDTAAEKQFEAFKLDPDTLYYFSGSAAHPTAIMGLKKAYALDNDLWKPIKPDPDDFKEFVQSMQDIAKFYSLQQRGFVMKDPKGKVLGVWYSLMSIRPMIVRMGEGNKVEVYTPDMYIYPTGGVGAGGAPSTPDAP